MSKYRINVRFDLDKPKEAKAAQYLQALDKSRNAFMVTAVLNEMQRQSSVPQKWHEHHQPRCNPEYDRRYTE